MDAQWSDDFHHALHTLLTHESAGYYLDFGRLEHLGKAVEEGFVYSGQYSRHRRRRHGSSSRHFPARQFVVCSQNHDQVGNRLLGQRLTTLVSFECLKLIAGMVILSPYIPLLFMGEEWGEKAPFLYFTSHSDAELIAAVRRGRKAEFAAFEWHAEPPDPQSEQTFLGCKVDHLLKKTAPHSALWELYQELIKLRKTLPSLAHLSKEQSEVRVSEKEQTIEIRRWHEGDEVLMIANFSEQAKPVHPASIDGGNWRTLVDSSDCRWAGPGSSVPAGISSGRKGELFLNQTSFSLLQRMG